VVFGPSPRGCLEKELLRYTELMLMPPGKAMRPSTMRACDDQRCVSACPRRISGG
jgi:hypothetical protein